MSTEVAEPAPAPIDNREQILKEKSPMAETTAPKNTIDSKTAGGEDGIPTLDESTEPVKKPLARPAPNCKPAPRAELTAEQQAKYNELLSAVSSWTDIPDASARNAPSSPITDRERLWLTRECLLRYLRATKWNTPAAVKRLVETTVWRREYGVYGLTADYIAPENGTGKQVIFGFDNEGRPCLYLNPNKQNTKQSERQIQHLVFMLERVIDLMAPGQETLALLINFKDSSASSNPSVGTGRQVLNILQNHYPERLGRALISHLPWYVTTFFKLISPFIDPVTKPKMKFNEPLTDHVPASQLLKTSGGDIDFIYDHDVYWLALNALCEQREKECRERWERAGKKIGESEIYLKGGDEGSIETGGNDREAAVQK